MDSEKTDTLSPEEAKQRLHQAVGELGVHALMKRHPYESLALSFAAGLVMAVSKPMRNAMLRMLSRLI
ncbi:MAG: hypothetical protein P8Z75_04510 [Gammaproteobacteria bacterium]